MSHAERMRRYRARLRDGEIIVPVPMTYDDIGVIIDLKLLPGNESEDRDKIGEAIKRALVELVAAYRDKKIS